MPHLHTCVVPPPPLPCSAPSATPAAAAVEEVQQPEFEAAYRDAIEAKDQKKADKLMADFTADVVARACSMLDRQLQVGADCGGCPAQSEQPVPAGPRPAQAVCCRACGLCSPAAAPSRKAPWGPGQAACLRPAISCPHGKIACVPSPATTLLPRPVQELTGQLGMNEVPDDATLNAMIEEATAVYGLHGPTQEKQGI